MANFSFPSTVNGQCSEWNVKPPRTSTATNKHPTRSFRSVGSGCRGAEALPKDLDEVGFFRQQTDKKGDIFSHGWRADWLIFHVNSLSQMANRLELLGIAYLVGKIGHLNFYFMVPNG